MKGALTGSGAVTLERLETEPAKAVERLPEVAEKTTERVSSRAQRDVLESLLAGPLLFAAGEPGRLSTRDELYDDILWRSAGRRG